MPGPIHWDRMVADLGVSVDLLHLDEMPADVRLAVAACGALVVLARLDANRALTPFSTSGWLATFAWVAVVLVYAALSSVWTAHDPGWYTQFAKPSFQPPDVVFGVVWPLNFLAPLGVGLWFTRSAASTGVWLATEVLAASVVAALIWARLFYVLHRIGAATVTLTVAAVLTWLLVALVARSLPWAGVVLAPYAVWLSMATALSVQYTRLN